MILFKILLVILGLGVLGLIVFVCLFFATKHRLDFSPSNKDFDKIVVYGDTRSQHKVHMKIADKISEENPEMILFTGDIAGNSRNPLHFLIYALIENKLWKKSEYYHTRGNHEDKLYNYTLFFDLPNGKTYYSFDRSGMHFIVLEVIEGGKPVDAEQLEWLKKDLAANDGKPIAVSMHIPLFTSGKYEPYNAPYLIELFEKHKVMFVFSAHVHCYERSYKNGINYIVTAGGGAPLYPVTRENPYKVIREQKHNYCVLTKNGDKYTLTAKDIDGNIIDNVTVSYEER